MNTDIKKPNLEHDFRIYLLEVNRPKVYLGSLDAEKRLIECGGVHFEDSEDICFIYFYEWSCVMKGIRSYTSKRDFLSWLDSCGISYSAEDVRKLVTNKAIHCACHKGKAELLVCDYNYKLKEILDKEV